MGNEFFESSDFLLPTIWDADAHQVGTSKKISQRNLNYLLLELFPVKTYLKHPEMKKNLPKYIQTHTWTPPNIWCQIDEGGIFLMQQFSGAFLRPKNTPADGWMPRWLSLWRLLCPTYLSDYIHLGSPKMWLGRFGVCFFWGFQRLELGMSGHTQKKQKQSIFERCFGCFLWFFTRWVCYVIVCAV